MLGQAAASVRQSNSADARVTNNMLFAATVLVIIGGILYL